MPRRSIPLPAESGDLRARHRTRLSSPSKAVTVRVALGVLALVTAAVVVLAVTTTPSASSPRAAVPVITAGAAPTPVVAVVAAGSSAALDAGWSARLSRSLEADATTVDAGTGTDLSAALLPVPTDADVVAVMADGLAPEDGLVATTSAALEAARLRAPYADLVLIGPTTSADRSGLAAIAARNGARWVDPSQLGWTGSTDVQRVSTVLAALLPGAS